MENILFEFYRGDTYTRDFTITGWSFPISNVYFTVKENIENKNVDLQKTLDKGITLVDITDGKYTYNLKISSTDTDKFKADTDYVFDIEIHSDMGDEIIKQTIATGILRVKASATKTCNEVVIK